MIIVTGGEGFIGGHLLRRLSVLSEPIAVIEDYQGRITMEDTPLGKMMDWKYTTSFFNLYGKEITAVYHLGALSSTTQPASPLLDEMNTFYTNKLFELCTQFKTPLVYASSASTYGDGEKGFADQRTLDELERLQPLNAYAVSKHRSDLAAVAAHEAGRAPPHWYGLKFFNVYGPGEDHKASQQSVISKWRNAVVNNKKIEIFEGTGDYGRDFVFVDDCVSVMLWLMREQPASGIYNVGSGNVTSFNTVIDRLRKRFRHVYLKIIPMPDNLKAHYQTYTRADLTKLRNAGYTNSFMHVSEGLQKYRELEREDV